jgi:hypothetical protein
LSDSTAITTNSPYGVDMTQFGLTSWTSVTSLPTGLKWSSIALSSSGQYQTVVAGNAEGNIYTSDNYGKSWNKQILVDSNFYWFSVSMSASGQYQTAVNTNDSNSKGNIHTSSNYGKTWTKTYSSTNPGNSYFESVSVSASGQYQCVLNYGNSNNAVYISTNYGQTWKNYLNVNLGWRGKIKMSASGQYLTLVYGSGTSGTWISSNYGETWSNINYSTNLFALDMSASGQYQTSGIYSGVGIRSLYTSSDYGKTWIQNTSASTNFDWNSISLSSSGQYQAATSDYYIWYSTNYGQTWSLTSAPTEFWLSLSVSSSGQYIVAGYAGGVYTTSIPTTFGGNVIINGTLTGPFGSGGPRESPDTLSIFSTSTLSLSNFGATWSQNATTLRWNYISTSSSGQYQTACVNDGFIHTSSDYGKIWLPNASAPSANWSAVSLSSTGQYQTAVVSRGQIYISSNYGTTWTPVYTNANYNGVSVSASGKYQTAVVNDNTGTLPSNIYISSDYGNSWNATSTIFSNTIQWKYVALSASGQYQTATPFNNNLYVSSDYGNTWLPKSLNHKWWSISLSASGQYQTAGVNNGPIYISNDFGNTWSLRLIDANRYWQSISLSSSGQYQCALSQTFINTNTNVYVSTDYGNTWTVTATSLGNLVWNSVSMSSSGQYITAVVDQGYIYTSSSHPTSVNNIAYNLYLTGATGQTGGAGNSANTDNNVYCNNVYAKSAVYANNVALTSDYRIKENVKPLDNKFHVDYLKPVSYTNKQTNEEDIGFIAHELQEHYPELVSGVKDGSELQRVNYIGLIPILVNEIKALKNNNIMLENEINNIKEFLKQFT